MTESIENPATGERIGFREATDGALRFDYYLELGGYAMGKVDHIHPLQEERFTIESGRLGVRIDGDEWTATPGSRFAILAGTPHTVWNDAPTETHAVIEMRPALDARTLFETMYGLARDGKTRRWGLPGPLQLAVVADEFREELAFAEVPVPIQRALATGVSPVGRRAGFRGRYPRYSGPRAESQ